MEITSAGSSREEAPSTQNALLRSRTRDEHQEVHNFPVSSVTAAPPPPSPECHHSTADKFAGVMHLENSILEQRSPLAAGGRRGMVPPPWPRRRPDSPSMDRPPLSCRVPDSRLDRLRVTAISFCLSCAFSSCRSSSGDRTTAKKLCLHKLGTGAEPARSLGRTNRCDSPASRNLGLAGIHGAAITCLGRFRLRAQGQKAT